MKNDFFENEKWFHSFVLLRFDNSESIKYYMRFRLLASEKAFSCFREHILKWNTKWMKNISMIRNANNETSNEFDFLEIHLKVVN